MPAKKDAVGDRRVPLSELVSRVSAISEEQKHAVTAVIRALKEEITRAVLAGEVIDLGADFGKFKLAMVAGRRHKIPSSEDPIISEDRMKLRFVPSAMALKKPVVTAS